jgi:hypothetical protein
LDRAQSNLAFETNGCTDVSGWPPACRRFCFGLEAAYFVRGSFDFVRGSFDLVGSSLERGTS